LGKIQKDAFPEKREAIIAEAIEKAEKLAATL
jgi:hypothetical protein